jgi:hypothetical protein
MKQRRVTSPVSVNDGGKFEPAKKSSRFIPIEMKNTNFLSLGALVQLWETVR